MVRLFKISIPASVIALVLSEAVLIVACYVATMYWTLEVAPDVYLIDEGGLWNVVLVAVVVLLGLYFNDLYENYRIRSRVLLLQQYCMALGVAFLLQGVLSYGRLNYLLLPKWVMVYGSLLALVVLPAWRMLFVSLVWKALGGQRLLFLGSSFAACQIVRRLLERPELGLTPIGYLESDGEDRAELPPELRLGRIEDLEQVVAAHDPQRIVVGMTERRQRLPVGRLLDLRYSGILIEEAATTYEAIFGRVSTRDLRPSQLIFSAELGPRHASLAVHTGYSVLLSVLGILITSPVMAAVAVVLKLTSPGPVLFRQKRVGKDGVPFMVLKFRSMCLDAEAATGAVRATRDDPRVTPVGRWLRKLRLDELPQLFNVLRGEMAIVGPRPERPEFVAVLQEKIPYYRQRHCVKPGITGWAQINHSYENSIEDTITKLEYDLFYIKNMAISLDAFIVFHTVKTMLLGRGAQ